MTDDSDMRTRAGQPEFRRREQIFEVLVFLFLIAPSMAFSFFAVKEGSIGFVVTAIATILRDLALVSLILFLSGETGKQLAGSAGFAGIYRQKFFGELYCLYPCFMLPEPWSQC